MGANLPTWGHVRKTLPIPTSHPTPKALPNTPHEASPKASPKASKAAAGDASEKFSLPNAESRQALFNTVKLSLSLLGTLVVAFAVRFMIPRYIGPSAFGQLNFADAFATSFFVFTTFGVDSYIRKEVSTRLEHANDFFAGFFVVRLLAALVIFALMALSLQWMNKGALEWRLSFIFALGQIAYVMNITLNALLHAASEVNELAWMNVVSKLLWGGGIYAGLILKAPLETVAVAFFISEGVKASYLCWVAQKKLHLRWRINTQATCAVVVASFPYYLNYMAHRTYEKLNISMLSVLTNDNEVGWFSAAVNVATISLLFLPILQAVVVPMASRTAAKSTEAMNELMRNAVRLVLISGTLISLILVLHAPWIVAHAFGKGFGPSAISLQMLAPMFPLTYLAVLGAMHLVQLNRIWTMVKISLIALVVNPVLNGPLIWLGHRMGEGWAGAMSSVASVFTEGMNAVLTFMILGQAAVDTRFWKALYKTIFVCAAVTALHMVLSAWGIWRMPLEVLVYGGLAILTGALPLDEVKNAIRNARGSPA